MVAVAWKKNGCERDWPRLHGQRFHRAINENRENTLRVEMKEERGNNSLIRIDALLDVSEGRLIYMCATSKICIIGAISRVPVMVIEWSGGI
jgi:hypothetical protein